MNKEIARYRRILKSNLHCGRAKRRTLLDQFEYSLLCFLEDCPSPTYTQLTDAFGPPEDMARVLMESVTKEEKIKYRKQQKLLKILKIAVIVLLAIFAIYTYYYKEYTIIEIYDELTQVQTIVTNGGK